MDLYTGAMKEIKVLPIKVEAEYEGKKFVMEKDRKSFPVRGGAYVAIIDGEWCSISDTVDEIHISSGSWRLTLKKPDTHPLYFPIISLIRALKGETD